MDGCGVPLSVVVDGANRHDMKMLEATLEGVEAPRPDPKELEQNLGLDAGYDYPQVDELVDNWGATAHISRRGASKHPQQPVPGYRARRWVVERTHSWMNRFRRLLIRWEKKKANYLAMIHIACAYVCLRHTGVFG